MAQPTTKAKPAKLRRGCILALPSSVPHQGSGQGEGFVLPLGFEAAMRDRGRAGLAQTVVTESCGKLWKAVERSSADLSKLKRRGAPKKNLTKADMTFLGATGSHAL